MKLRYKIANWFLKPYIEITQDKIELKVGDKRIMFWEGKTVEMIITKIN